MKHIYRLFFVLFFVGLLGCDGKVSAATEESCEIVFYAKTLEGADEISVCLDSRNAIVKMGKVDGELVRNFSVPVSDIRYHVGYSEFADEEELELYIPHQSFWYGFYLYRNLEHVTDADFSISRNVKTVSPVFYDKFILLQRTILDTESIVDKIRYHSFTPF